MMMHPLAVRLTFFKDNYLGPFFTRVKVLIENALEPDELETLRVLGAGGFGLDT